MDKPAFARFFFRFIDFLMLALAAGLLGWSGCRAGSLSMTIDEAYSFMFHSPHPVADIFFSPDRFTNANNHVLNTLSAKFFTTLFGTEREWAVRFGSVLGHLVYLVFSWRLVRLVSSNPMARLAGFVLLNFNLFMLDFFSMARGYGMSVGFMMAAIFYTFRFYHVENHRNIWLAGLWTTLAVMANFTALNFLAVWWLMLNLGSWLFFGAQKWRTGFWKINAPAAAVSAAITLVFGRQIGWLRKLDEFKNGADSLMITFREAVNDSMMNIQYFKTGTNTNAIFTDIIFYTLFAVLVGSLVFGLFPKRGRKPTAFVGMLFLAVLLLGLLGQFQWLGTKFLVHRTALLIFPLAGLAVWLFLDEMDARLKKPASWLMQVVLFLFAFFPVYHAIRARHFEGTREWYFDETTKEMCQFVASIARERGKPVDLATWWAYTPASTYYQTYYFPNEIAPINYEGSLRKDSLFEFYYLEDRDLPKMNPAYQELKRFGGWRYLMQRKP